MQVYITVCAGMGDLEIKVFSKPQWENLLLSKGYIDNDDVLDTDDYLYRFNSVQTLLGVARVADFEIENEWSGCIY